MMSNRRKPRLMKNSLMMSNRRKPAPLERQSNDVKPRKTKANEEHSNHVKQAKIQRHWSDSLMMSNRGKPRLMKNSLMMSNRRKPGPREAIDSLANHVNGTGSAELTKPLGNYLKHTDWNTHGLNTKRLPAICVEGNDNTGARSDGLMTSNWVSGQEAR